MDPVTAAPVLSVRVAKRLGDFSLEVSFEAGPGITVLFGPSGAGKSAILAAIAGALRPDVGRIALGETLFFDAATRIDRPPERRGIGWVFQDARLFPHLNVERNLRYGLKRARLRNDGAEPQTTGAPRIDFAEVVEVLGLQAFLRRRPRDLSGGEAQRVALGRALLSQPRLLLMDEPLSSLDAARKGDILAFIERVLAAFPIPTLYVTHARAEAVRLADRVVAVEGGRIVASGALADMMNRPDLRLFAEPHGAALAQPSLFL